MPPVPIPAFPIKVIFAHDQFLPNMFTGVGYSIFLNSGLTTLLGPNGAGKTSVLKAMRDVLRENYGQGVVRYVSAGRMGIIEQYRSNMHGTGDSDANNTSAGSQERVSGRTQIESIIGDFYTLDIRADVRLKVEARLQGLFGKTILLNWTQQGLRIQFKSIQPGTIAYGAGREASGLTQLVSLLAALYDDDVKFLLIDEPEVSLHPQLQSFLLKEIKLVQGNPNTASKKVVVISTHSPSMLSIKEAPDLCDIVFFKETTELPIQVSQTDPILTDPNIQSLIIRLNELYKIALFSKSVLLSEGVSDEIILSKLIDRYDENFSSGGGQQISVNGKGELITAQKLFRKIGKKVSALGDLDILDDDAVVQYVDTLAGNVAVGAYANLQALFVAADQNLGNLVTNNWNDISALASTHYYFSIGKDLQLQKKRSALAFILNSTPHTLGALNNSALWAGLVPDYNLILNTVENHSFILVRKGMLENCFINPGIPATAKKPVKASMEATFLQTAPEPSISVSYTDPIKAINKIRQEPLVDEALLLRNRLGAILGILWPNIKAATTNLDISEMIDKYDSSAGKLFRITKIVNGAVTSLRIEFVSSLFSGYQQFDYAENEPITVLNQRLPSK